MKVYRHMQTDDNLQIYRQWSGKAKSANDPKSVLPRLPHNFPMEKLCKITNYKTTTSFQIENYPKAILSRPAYLQNIKKYPKSVNSKTTPFSDNNNYWKSVLAILLHPSTGNCKEISPFKTTGPPQSGYCWKSVLITSPHPHKVKIVQNQSFQGYQIQSKKWLKISPFRTTTSTQSGKCLQLAFTSPLHPPKVKITINHSFEDDHTIPK